MKAKELIGLLEYGKAFSPRREEKRRYKKEKKADFTFKEYIRFQQELKAFEDWQKEQQDKEKKLAKLKEVKKEGISTAHLAMFLVASFPITAPLYVYGVKMLLESMK